MTDAHPQRLGQAVWHDLTVNDAGALRDFYQAVCGWTAEPHDMGDYVDYTMKTADGAVAAGICHARGANAALPPVWLCYVTVASLSDAMAEVRRRGGRIIDERLQDGAGFAVIEDPAGAVLALWQPG
ncbi:MAG: VOC family protein [Pseudomonadota bacterium]